MTKPHRAMRWGVNPRAEALGLVKDDGRFINESIHNLSREGLPLWVIEAITVERDKSECLSLCPVPRIVLNPHQPIRTDAETLANNPDQIFRIVGD